MSDRNVTHFSEVFKHIFTHFSDFSIAEKNKDNRGCKKTQKIPYKATVKCGFVGIYFFKFGVFYSPYRLKYSTRS